MKNKLLTALLLLASLQTMATLTDAAAASSSQASMGSASKDDVRFLMDNPFSIVSTLSGKCVDADNWGNTSDTTIHMYSCNKNPRKGTNQLFKLMPTQDPHEFLIAFTHSNKCLTTENNQNGSRLMQRDCDDQDAKQRFSLTHAAKLGFYQIQQNGKCLDVKDGNKADHAGLQMWDCTGGNPNQTFSLKPALSFNDLPDELVGLIFNQCSAGAQKALRAVNHDCAKLYSEMTEKRSVIIDMDRVSHLVQQGRAVSELHTWLSQAHVIEIRNATASHLRDLLPHRAKIRQLSVIIGMETVGISLNQSELHTWLSQAHAINIQNATLANFPALLPHMRQVRRLQVKINPSERDQNRLQIIQAIANSPYMANLTNLDLWNNKIGAAGATAIANSPHMSNLTALNLNINNIGPAGATAIAQSPHMSNLTALNLSSNKIGDAGATAIANGTLNNLTSLDLSFNNIGSAGATAITQSPHMANLTTLSLGCNQIGDAGATAIANGTLSKLTALNLTYNNIGSAGATAIAQSQYMSKLTRLDLWNNKIGDAGATAIAQSPYMANLTRLDLDANNIGSAGATAIAQSQYMSKLTSLHLHRNKIGPAAEAAVKKRFPFARF